MVGISGIISCVTFDYSQFHVLGRSMTKLVFI